MENGHATNGLPPKTPNRIFIGMPGYGGMQTADAGRALWFACQDQNRPIIRYQCGSLLAANFNVLWATALNMKRAGIDIRYFAMLHSDIGAEDFWLDTMLAELEERSLDVLSAVVAIKDGKGMTSTALDNPANSWEPLCRLTLKEIFRLPETFTAEDVGHPLLLNTGCWVCKFDPSWTEKVRFTVNDTITWDETKECFKARVEPEDWNFSRQLNRRGLKLGATRKIKIAHRGEMDFPNVGPWGDELFDSAYLKESLIPQLPADSINFPYDVKGWLSYEEGQALAELATGKNVLEVGSYCGRSTICLAQRAKRVYAVDPHDGRQAGPAKDSLLEMNKNLQRYEVRHRVDIFKMTLADIVGNLNQGYFELIFIDGDHSYESVADDIRRALPLLAPGGILAFHDYGDRPGVTQAVDELLAGGATLQSIHKTLAVVVPPALVPTEA